VPTIRVLPPELANQIAAGEVVERPASVVKELLENALDAEATRIDVAIDGGGITRIAVQDDGFGMSLEDAKLSLTRHATSKLAAFADLAQLRSFGFRGEALPSIASVCRLSLLTRARGEESGFELFVEPGSAAQAKPLGAAVGTRLEVRDLFFNVPARRKFLRSSATEAGHVSEVVEQVALARPDVTITLTRDGRRVREFLRVSTRSERVQQVLGEDALARCDGVRGPLGLEAFLSRPEQARSGAAGLRLFVNGRAIRDRAIAATIAHAYGSVLERGRYPRGVAYLELPLELVDVNVHPQKAEVRFADPRALTDAVYGILSRALASAFSLPPRPPRAPGGRGGPDLLAPRDEPALRAFDFRPRAAAAALESQASRDDEPVPTLASLPQPREAALPAGDPLGDQLTATSLSERQAATSSRRPAFGEARLTAQHAGAESALLSVRDSTAAMTRSGPDVSWSSLRFLVQIRLTYLLCEGDDGLYLLDQHAAAERVTFTRLCRQYRSRAVPSQALLFPVLCQATAPEVDLVELHAQSIAELGLDVRVRGSETLSIHALPKLLHRASPERLLRDLITEVSRQGERGFSDAVELALATMACHGSLRAGDSVTPDEARALLTALDDADFAGHCPHGRPVVTFLGFGELERKVGRR
jgi:DNA mismatch repair protein MutL